MWDEPTKEEVREVLSYDEEMQAKLAKIRAGWQDGVRKNRSAHDGLSNKASGVSRGVSKQGGRKTSGKLYE